MSRLHTVRIGWMIPAAVLRLGLALVGAATALWLTDVQLWKVLLVVAGLAAAAVPRTPAPWVLVLLISVALLVAPASVGSACLAVLAAHLAHVLGTLSYEIDVRSRIALRALGPTATRFVAVQLVAQPAAVVSVVLLKPTNGPGEGWFAVAAAVAIALLGAVLLRLLGGRLPLGADPDQDSVVAAETTSASSAGGVQTRPSSPT